jgi:glycerol-3-phosphate dehydrogenase
MWAGIRPLVRAGKGKNTAALSRDHTIHIDESQLLTITGGKWTTYRNMAEDCVNRAAAMAGLPARPCVTKELKIRDRKLTAENQSPEEKLHPDLCCCSADVLGAARQEMARTVEDVLARRTRALFLNARAAMEMAPRVAELLAQELGRDAGWQEQQIKEFTALAQGYLPK